MPELAPPVHAILSAFIKDRLGLHYGPDDRGLLADKLEVRLQDAGFESALDYYYHLRYDDADGVELARLAEVLTVNESYFFREYDQLELIVEHLLSPAIARGGRPRVWSAACASGEEPLTLAMMMAARGQLESVEIVASDISSRVLHRARHGTWSARAMRSLPDPALARRYLTLENDVVTIVPSLREAISWRRLNLIDDEAVGKLGVFDVILCRNVLIYFDDPTVKHVVANLVGRLVSDGALFVGVSESLLRFGTSLHCEEHGRVFYYRKAG